MDNNVKKMLLDLTKSESLAKQKELAQSLGEPFKWPSIEEQVVNKGSIKDYKRGRMKHSRLMFHIPSVQLQNGLTMPGFDCHPDMAVAAAKELLRLAGRDIE